MRLNRFLAAAGLGSRRTVESLIRSGRVSKNGITAALPTQVDLQTDLVAVDGQPVKLPDHPTYLMLNKPPGYTVTREDRHAHRSVYELLPAGHRSLAYVGRLDCDSEGLLLFCNDGELCHRLLLPAFKVEREYRVRVEGEWRKSLEAEMLSGVTQEDGVRLRASRVQAREVWPGGGELVVVLQEGKKREIRRLCAVLQLAVTRLCRVRFGTLELGDLVAGRCRELSEGEAKALRQLVNLPPPA